jgi:catechol 2,3-dioxygenase-like lactoylglutathione lyase family enzyme
MTQSVFPELRTTDWERTKAFYVGGLGFTVDWAHRFQPDLPVFAQLTRDGLSVFVSGHGAGERAGCAAYFFVTDVDAWHRDFAGRGVQPAVSPQDMDYGIREMTVLDPDGNRLRFGTQIG